MEIVYRSVNELTPLPENSQLFQQPQDYESLKADIKKNGVRSPLHISPVNLVLDGNTRLRIAKELGIESLPCQVIEDAPNPLIYAIKSNLLRRQITWEERFWLIGKLAEIYKEVEGFENDNEVTQFISEDLKVSVNTVKKARRYLDIVNENPDLRGIPVNTVLIYDRRKKELEQKKADVIENELEFEGYLNDDCLKVIPTLLDNSVDIILTDPPYGIDLNLTRRNTSVGRGYRPSANKFRKIGEDLDETAGPIIGDKPEEALNLLDQMLKLMEPKLKDNAHVFCFCRWDVFADFYKIIEQYYEPRSCIVWVKDNHSSGGPNNFFPKHEMIIYARKGEAIVPRPIQNVIECPKVYRPLHPNQKPTDLLKTLLEAVSVEGEIVFDGFAGVGTTYQACRELGLNCIAVELDPKWFNLGKVFLAGNNESGITEEENGDSDESSE